MRSIVLYLMAFKHDQNMNKFITIYTERRRRGVEVRTGEEGGIGVPTEGRGVGGGVRTGGEGGVGLRTGEEGGNSTLYLSV